MNSEALHPTTNTPFTKVEISIQSPFSKNITQLTQEAHIKLKWEANYWKGQHKQVKQKYEAMKRELETANAAYS